MPTAVTRKQLARLTFEERVARFQWMMGNIVPVPEDWLVAPGQGRVRAEDGTLLEPIPCTSYRDLIKAWRKALRWRPAMDYVLSSMLSIAASTDQVGDQLFALVVGSAGSAKTRFAEAMLTSTKCYQLEHVKGFYSGWKDGSGEDYSLLARINHCTLITPEGDTVLSGPNFAEIMGQQRRIFDGTGSASFKNRKEDIKHTGLRTPWIICGTQSLVDRFEDDQSRLGDRFLRIYFEPPEPDEREQILRKVAHSAAAAFMLKSGDNPRSHMDENMCRAYQMTGGYIDYLRNNIEKLATVERLRHTDEDLDLCQKMGELVSYLRSRPPKNKHGEAGREEPTRLTHQFVRLMLAQTLVLNEEQVAAEVLQRVARTAIYTGSGPIHRIVQQLYHSKEGLDVRGLGILLAYTDGDVRGFIRFLKKIGVVDEHKHAQVGSRSLVHVYTLDKRLREYYKRVAEYAYAGDSDA